MEPELPDFEAKLAIHGADLARWPAAERSAAEALIVSSADARRLLQDAIALDRVLDAGAETVLVSHAQMDRVLAAALAARPAAPAANSGTGVTGTVVSLPRRDTSRPAEVLPKRPVRAAFGSGSWKAAAVLAFALFSGVAIGALDVAPGMLASVGEMVGLVSDSDLVIAAFPVDGLDPLIDEDQL